MGVEKIEYKDKLFAIVLRKDLNPNKMKFYTPEENSLQVGFVKHEKGYTEDPHIHKSKKRIIYDVQETLHIIEGKVKMKFYSENKNKINETLLTPGDVILLVEGAHAIEIIEDLKAVKVKQGPYMGIEEDKIIFGE